MFQITTTSILILKNMLSTILDDNPTELKKNFNLKELGERQEITLEQTILCLNYLIDCGLIKTNEVYSDETITRDVTITTKGVEVAER